MEEISIIKYAVPFQNSSFFGSALLLGYGCQQLDI